MDFCLDNTDEAHKHPTHFTHNQLLGEGDNENQSLEKKSWLLPPRAKQPQSRGRYQSWFMKERCAACPTKYNMIPPNTLSIAGDEHLAQTFWEQILSLVPAAGCSECKSTRSR